MSISSPIRRGLLFFAALATACAPLKRPTDGALQSTSADTANLDEKLDAQFARYDAARTQFLQTVAAEKQELSREDWESLLRGPTFTASDLEALKARQLHLATVEQEASLKRSVLDLAKVREHGDVKAFCRDLPKGGMLHVHPYGTLDRATVHDVLTKVDPPLDLGKLAGTLNQPGTTGTLAPHELEHLRSLAAKFPTPVTFSTLSADDRAYLENLFFLPSGSHPFDRFTAVFTTVSALLFANHAVDPEKLVEDAFFHRASEHHVRYIEITRFIIPRTQWLESLPAWAASVHQRYGIRPRYLAAFARNKDPSYTRTKAEQLLKLPESPELVGINILGDETSYPALEFGQTLYGPVLAAAEQGTSRLHRTAHAGELGDPRNVRDMLVMGVERLGHGVKLADDPVTLEYARLHRVPVEVNLVSNLRLQVVPSIKAHPFLLFLRLGLPVSLSTDDEGIFESTIDDECIAAVTGTDVTYDELKTMARNGVATSFADADTKASVLAEVDQDFSVFETTWAKLRRVP